MVGLGYPTDVEKERGRPSAETILPLATIKSWLRIPHDDDDDLLNILRSSAIAEAEKATNLHLGTATITATYRPDYVAQVLSLTEVPVAAVSSVLDGEDATESIYATTTLTQHGVFHHLAPPEDDGWEGREVRVSYTAAVDFTTHPDADLLRTAMLTLMGGAYENRESEAMREYHRNPAVRRTLTCLRVPRLWTRLQDTDQRRRQYRRRLGGSL